MKKIAVSYVLEVRNYNQDDEEIPISAGQAEDLIGDLTRDVETVHEGLEAQHDFTFQVHSIDVEELE